jgi:hypothetical protein
MGGSRRRNVPDQMEQPMMRNEHIVRAHQAPVQAINPFTSDPWRVIHVDNTATNAPSGNGTDANPYTTLAQAQTAASAAYDIVYVHQGNSLNSPYAGTFTFQADNQYLLGEGSNVSIPTVDCGFLSIANISSASSNYPTLSNPTGDSIVLTNGASTNPTVDHLQVVGSAIGITDGNGLPSGGIATINDVVIKGNGAGQTGVLIQDISGGDGTFNFMNMKLSNLTADAFVVDGNVTGGSNPQVNISDSSIDNTTGSAVVVNDIVKDDFTGQGGVRLANSTIDGTTDAGVTVSGGIALIEGVDMISIGTAGVSVTGRPNTSDPLVTAGTSTVQVVNSTIAAVIGVQGSSPNSGDLLNLTINQNRFTSPSGGNGVNLAVGGGKINTYIVGNTFNAPATTTITTGTAGGITAPGALASNIYLTTSDTAGGLNNLTVKAVSADNLTAINRNATVTTSPQQNPINTGTSSPLVPPPPPPNYDPSVIVPLPRQ